MLRGGLQMALRLLYPPRCLCCGGMVEDDHGLCPTCFSDTPFVSGLVCDACGVPLPGQQGEIAHCDDCLRVARPWRRGRAPLLYGGAGRRLVLALKHGDRHDIVAPAADWMAQAARPICRTDMLVVPVPLHLTRLVRRRFNQSALLAQALARRLGLPYCPDALVRTRRTAALEGKTREERSAEVREAIAVAPHRRRLIGQRRVLIVDDVMTSGATLAACALACNDAQAEEVCVSVLARVAKTP